MLDEFRSTSITWDKATRRIYSPITANASDENGRKLVVQIVNSGQVEDLTGATLHLYWETRDKVHDGLDVFDAVDLKKGEFELSYTTGMLSNQGVLNANLVLIDTVGRVVSERFKITVTEGIDNDAIQSENSFSSLTQALIDVSNLEQNYAPRLNDLTAQLQQIPNQTDIVDKVNRITNYDDLYLMRRSGTQDISVILKKNDDLVVWEMLSNAYDDFKQLGRAYIAKATPPEKFLEDKSYVLGSGEIMESIEPYEWMKTVGGRISVTFTGTGIDFNHLKDNRGGVWRFTINTTPVQSIDVETFNYSMIEDYRKPLFNNLPQGTYTVTGEFIGGGLTSTSEPRGWLNKEKTFTIYEADPDSTQFRVEEVDEVVVGFSNKELALQFKPKNSNLRNVYTPMHTAIPTTFDRIPMRVLVDGKELLNTTETLESNKVYKHSEVAFIQHMRVKHPDHDRDSFNFNTIHHFDKTGNVDFNCKLIVLEDVEVVELFTFMLPAKTEMVNHLVSSKGNEYITEKTDGSLTHTPKEGRTTKSYAFLSSLNNYVFSGRINGLLETNFLNMDFDEDLYNSSWIQHRDSEMQKAYTYALRDSEFSQGDRYRFSTTFNLSKVENVSAFM